MAQLSFLVTVRAVIQETEDTVTLVFERSPYLLDYKAGQFITFIVDIEGEMLRRSYSLATCSDIDRYPAITVKHIAGGKVSNYLNSEVGIGDELEVLPVAGSFVLPDVFPKSYRGVFVAGGSGITPIFSLMKDLLYREEYTEAMLVYASRDEEHIIYADWLRELEDRYGVRVRVVHVLSRASDGWKGMRGRLSSSGLAKLLLGYGLGEDVHYFLCGPQGLMELARDTFRLLGIAESHIHQESFVLKKGEKKVPMVSKVTIHYEGEGYDCEVDAGTTLLDAALDVGVDVPFSCSSGMCNACRARCVEGKVRMVEDEGLTEEEKEEGYVLTCVGYAASERVVLEVD